MRGSASFTASRPTRTGPAAVRAITVATGTSTAGSVLNVVAVLSYTYAATGAPVSLGVAVVSGFLPVALLLPVIGGRLPVGSERRTVLLAVLAQAAGAATMAALSVTRWLVAMFLLVAAMGVLAMITRISLLCLLPRVAGPAGLTGANLRLQVAAQLGAGVGAGLLLARGVTPPWVMFLVDAVSFVLQAGLLARILPAAGVARRDPPPGNAAVPPGHWALVLALLPAGFCAMNLLNAVMPLVAFDRLHAGQRALAAAEVVYPVAAVAVGFLVRRKGRLSMPGAILGLALGFVVLAAADRLVLLLVGVGVLGVAVVMSNATTQVWAQSSLPAGALARWQSRAAAWGATVSTVGVLGISAGFAAGRQAGVLLAVAVLFTGLAGLAVVASRKELACR